MDVSKRKPEVRKTQENTRPRTPPSYEEIAKYGHSLHVKKFTNEEVRLENDYPWVISYDPPKK
ncbi:cytoplasmic protein [Raccoonpox virus]|uniref:IActA-like protein n=1 Tax=Raccoon poxvirus TaxID=10256 RepID=A0A0G3FXJ6_RACVI|nr:iActA-like protein [Raccoonpox virus]AKJ93675.1 iActA-like protein [Raccoonpox virus]AOP31306.1 cytoplasmic protein [Raccoonpox virus]